MVEENTSANRQVITSSSWWIWVVLLVGIGIILLFIYGAWRLFRGATSAVRDQTEVVATTRQEPEVRFVRTPTEVILVDDPIIPEGETSVEEIVRNFAEYQGDQVVISGSVNDVTTTVFFTVLQGDYEIGVLGLPEVLQSNELDDSLNPRNEFVRITGTVKLLTKEREKTEFGFDFRHLDEAVWRDQMIIEATRIEVLTPQTS